MNKDELIKEAREQASTWQAALVVYGVIVVTMVLSAWAIL